MSPTTAKSHSAMHGWKVFQIAQTSPGRLPHSLSNENSHRRKERAVVIHQVSHDDGDVLIFICPDNAPTLCRAILKAAGLDPDSASCTVTAKDPTANDRQRRHREKLRDSHGRLNVTVTAEPTCEVEETARKEARRPQAD